MNITQSEETLRVEIRDLCAGFDTRESPRATLDCEVFANEPKSSAAPQITSSLGQGTEILVELPLGQLAGHELPDGANSEQPSSD